MLYMRTAPSTGEGMSERAPEMLGKKAAIINMILAKYATLRLVIPLALAMPIFVVAVDCIGPPTNPERKVPSALALIPPSIDFQFGLK